MKPGRIIQVPGPGLHLGVPFEDYRLWPAINASLLHGYARSPKHARHEQLTGRPDTEELALGHAAHCAILEPDEFRARFVAKRRATGKDSREANRQLKVALVAQGLTELTEEQLQAARGMRDEVMEHQTAGPLVREAFGREVSALWEDPEFGVQMKARFDLISGLPGRGTVVADLKTCRNASPRKFLSAAVDLGYHVAAAHYLGGLAALQPGHERGWCWIAVESEPPHDVVVYEADEDLLRRGWEESRRLLALHLDAVRSQRWRGHSDQLVTLSAPRWL